mgnify:CR=1 FL=1
MKHLTKAQMGFFYSSPHAAQEEIYPLIMELYRWADATEHYGPSINLEALSNCNPQNEEETIRARIIRCADLMTKWKTYLEREKTQKRIDENEGLRKEGKV